MKLQAHREEGKVSWDQQVTFCSETWPTFDNEKVREVNTRDTTQTNPIYPHRLTIASQLCPNVAYSRDLYHPYESHPNLIISSNISNYIIKTKSLSTYQMHTQFDRC